MFAFFLALIATTVLAQGTCLNPQLPNPLTFTNPPALNQQDTVITINPGGTGNQTNQLDIVASWAYTVNRTVIYAGIGDQFSQCGNIIINPDASGPSGWNFTEGNDSSCLSVLSTSYFWPEVFYTPSCATNFLVQETSTQTFVYFSVTIIVQEDYTDSRSGQTVSRQFTEILNASLVFDNVVSISSNAAQVYSASSEAVSALLLTQTIQPPTPFTIAFYTLINANFSLAYDSKIFTATANDSAIGIWNISAPTTSIIGGTKRQDWTVYITPATGSCTLSGFYFFNFTINFNGPAINNPIPGGSSWATVNFTLSSSSWCSTPVGSEYGLTAALYVYQSTNFSTSEHQSFFNGDNSLVYFRVSVTSVSLPILSTSVTSFSFNKQGSTNSTAVIESSFPVAPFQIASISGAPRNEDWFSLVLSPTAFPIPQDKSFEYTFFGEALVAYNLNGQKKRNSFRLNVRQNGAGAIFSSIPSKSLTIASSNLASSEPPSSASPTATSKTGEENSAASGYSTSIFLLVVIFFTNYLYLM